MLVRSRIRTTQWNLLFHYVSIGLMMISGVVLVPLYLRYISLDLYGAWLATGNVLMWLTAVDPGLSTVLQQRVGTAYGKGDIQSVRGFMAAGLLLSAAISVLLVLLGYATIDYIPAWLRLPDDLDQSLLLQAFWIAVLGSSLSLFSYSITAISQGLQSSLGIGLVYVVVHVLDIVLILVLLFAGFGLLALAFSALFRGVGLLAGNAGYLCWRLFREKIGFSFSTQNIAELIKLVPFTFSARAGGLIANNVDAFVVARFLGVDIVPVLILTRKAIDISRKLVERPAIAFMPAVSHLVGAGETHKAKNVLARLVYMKIWLLALTFGGLVSMNDDFVRLWVGEQLFAGYAINVLLCFGLLLAAMTRSLANLCMALGDIKRNSLMILAQSLIFILLVLLGAKYFELIGVVLAPLIAMLLISVWYFPRSFSSMLRLSAGERMGMLSEFIISLLAASAPVYLFADIAPQGWLEFCGLVLAFSLAYGLLLCGISSAFRKELVGVWRKLAGRFAT